MATQKAPGRTWGAWCRLIGRWGTSLVRPGLPPIYQAVRIWTTAEAGARSTYPRVEQPLV